MTSTEQGEHRPRASRGWRPSIRAALFAILATTVALLSVGMSAISGLQAAQAERRLAAILVDDLQARVEAQLQQLLRPLEQRLATDLDRVRSGGLPRYRPAELTRQLLPSMRHLRGVDSMMLGDEQGHQLLLMRWSEEARSSPLLAGVPDLPAVEPGQHRYFTRDFRPSEWGERSRWTLWSEIGDEAVTSWEVELPGYDPRQRPWHSQAVRRLTELEQRGDAASASPVAWTSVYTMFTTKTPGVSASAAARCTDGSITIVAYDLLLDDLREFVATLEPTPHSRAFLCTAAGETLALPAAGPETLMQPLEQVAPPPVRAWHRRWLLRDAERGSTMFEHGGETWWGSWLPLRLGDNDPMWLGVVVPRADLLELAGRDLDHPFGLALGAALLALLLASVLAWRLQRPLRDVLTMSRRIGDLKLEDTPRPRSRIAELDELIETLTATRAQLRARIAERDRAAEQLAQREAQLQQTQRLEAVGRLAGGIAHDFNNLLTCMLGHLELLRERADDRDAADLTSIERAIHSGAALVRQLLTFARRDRPAPQVLDLGAELRESESLLRRLLREDVELRLHIAPGRHIARIDPTQLQQVIVNLVVNARDAIRELGSVRIDVTRGPETLPTHTEILVSDDGCGMSAEVLQHAFEPFFTRKPAGEGSGLGLTTCYGIVHQAGGDITLRSTPGLGTTVRIRLPRCDDEPAPRPPVSRATTRGNGTVLWVEDEAALRDLARRTLEEHGYRVLCAARADEALQLAADEPHIGLLLTDVVMPGMSGGELAKRLRAERPQLPVLFVSGYANEHLEGRLPDGAQLLAKPYTPQQLLQRVSEILEVDRTSRMPN
ncbi:MAG: response regulator [Planctomycetes bacterium]|nr:response regulator [Planctomycetota bacterium]